MKVPAVVVPVAGTVAGVVVGAIADKKLGEWGELGTLYTADTYTLAYHDLLLIVVGFFLVLFGGRIHRFVKYFGLGFLAYNLGEELYEIITKEASF